MNELGWAWGSAIVPINQWLGNIFPSTKEDNIKSQYIIDFLVPDAIRAGRAEGIASTIGGICVTFVWGDGKGRVTLQAPPKIFWRYIFAPQWQILYAIEGVSDISNALSSFTNDEFNIKITLLDLSNKITLHTLNVLLSALSQRVVLADLHS